ncbi:DUF6282 family protein [Sediminicoccus sp. KRV36]|uniref:DUF6282 family protein n=1 Tax=Sediminicoccus sp. KRV36 TaxID=3133721 RepID=UPI00200FEEDD|nr:DUF6282 family protein [Sediminicoccus rosea]UPY37327.1 DUF6282 family protein [Sediminicoccus rosea]
MPGTDWLRGAIDGHVHCAPHLNARSVHVFEAVRQAAAAGMRGLGIMCNFQNSSGFAALANAELGHLGCEAFGGLIMQPAAGGVTLEAARTALGYGYGAGQGARFISLPTHHTRFVAEQEGRSPAFLETTFHIPRHGRVPEPVPAIMELCAAHEAAFDCGHVAGYEAVALAEEAARRGVTRLRAHGAGYAPDEVAALAALGAHVEFSFFLLTHATQVGLTHADAEKHRIAGACTVQEMATRIRAASARAVLSSDAGLAILPPPVEALREFLLLLASEGFTETELRRMTRDNPARLFNIAL